MGELRMSAYYYDFEPTGNPHVDNILSAVAWAGRAFHHTDQWTEESDPRESSHRGRTPVEWIQNAAIDAAAALNSVEKIATQSNAQAQLAEACKSVQADLENAAAHSRLVPGQPDKWWLEERATRLRDALAVLVAPNKTSAVGVKP
jgi:hypothetical protein